MIAPDPIAEAIAALRDRRDTILARWLTYAREQPFHRAQPDAAVTDHVPILLDTLLAALDTVANTDAAGQRAAEAHARARAAQGLDSGDVVTEFRLLRTTIQMALAEGPTLTAEALLALEARIHDELDALVSTALRAFDRISRARAGGIETMGRVAREISALRPVEDTLHLVCERVRELLAADQSTIALGSDAGDLVFAAANGGVIFSIAGARLASGEGVGGRAFATAAPVVAGGKEDDPATLAPVEQTGGVRALLAVPLRRGARAVGVLSAGSVPPRQWTDDETMLLEALAAQVTIALDNAHLYAALSQRERLLNQVVAEAPALVAVVRSPDRRYALANPRYQSLAPGRTLPGATVEEAHVGAFGATLDDAVRRAYGGEVFELSDLQVETTDAHGGAEKRHVTFSILPLAVDDETQGGALIVGYETTEAVTQRRRIEVLATLASARADTLAAVIGAMPDGVFVCDTERRIATINRSGIELLGARDAAALLTLEDLMVLAPRSVGGAALDIEQFSLARALRGERSSTEEVVIRRADTGVDRVLRLSTAPIHDASGAITGAVCVANDVTALRDLERKRDEWVSRASHELKTPLTSAKGLLQLVRRRLARSGDDAQIPSMVETVERQVDRLSVLIDDLRSVNHIRTDQLRLRPVDLDLRTLVGQEVQAMQATTETHTLQMAEAGSAVPVHGDPTRLAQVLDNLLSNAIKYSPDGGTVEVSCRIEGNRGMVDVRDRGIGVPPQDRAILFEPFQRASNADDAATGMGLGLYIARSIALQHGGELELIESGREGSIFRFTLPLVGSATP